MTAVADDQSVEAVGLLRGEGNRHLVMKLRQEPYTIFVQQVSVRGQKDIVDPA